jgi:hypothetical protein
MMQQMELQMKALAVEKAWLAGLVATLMESNSRPNKQIEQICADPSATSTEIVEWTPSHNRRRSKKTPLQLACRTPPRPPPGTPQSKKKSKVSSSPSNNQFDALSDDLSDVEMD